MLRITVEDRRRDIGLGGYPSVSLARAREKAAEYRTAIAEGRDPVAEKHAPAMPTFREAAQAVHEANKPRWHNPRHASGWIQTLERHAMPVLGNTPLDRIDRGDVLRVLTPIWTSRRETARRVRQRMRTIFRWAMAHGFIESFNGKLWDELLDREIFYTMLELRVLTEWYRQTFNWVRPHSSLGYRAPAPETLLPADPVPVLVGVT